MPTPRCATREVAAPRRGVARGRGPHACARGARDPGAPARRGRRRRERTRGRRHVARGAGLRRGRQRVAEPAVHDGAPRRRGARDREPHDRPGEVDRGLDGGPVRRVHARARRRGWAHAAGARQGRQRRTASIGRAGDGADRRRARRRGSRTPACELAPDASTHLLAHLGDDAGRVPELVEVLASAYGGGATIGRRRRRGLSRRRRHRGPFDLTNAIDRGDVARRRSRCCTGCSRRRARAQPKPLHPMQVMATLVRHYQRLLRLDDPSITHEGTGRGGARDEERRRSPVPARGVEAARDRRSARRDAVCSPRPSSTSGASGLDERTVIDVLVARLAASTRRHRAARPAPGASGSGRLSLRPWRASSGARCGGRPGSCG